MQCNINVDTEHLTITHTTYTTDTFNAFGFFSKPSSTVKKNSYSKIYLILPANVNKLGSKRLFPLLLFFETTWKI